MSTSAGPSGSGRAIEGRTDTLWPCDGMVITLAMPVKQFDRSDILIVRGADGDVLDMALATIRADDLPSVWYAVNPTLRHWLGWLERQDEWRWRFHMEPFHSALLEDMRPVTA